MDSKSLLRSLQKTAAFILCLSSFLPPSLLKSLIPREASCPCGSCITEELMCWGAVELSLQAVTEACTQICVSVLGSGNSNPAKPLDEDK